MADKPAHILVAEDDKSVRLVVQQALARQGYTVQSSGTAAGLWKLIESGRGDVLISDIRGGSRPIYRWQPSQPRAWACSLGAEACVDRTDAFAPDS